MAQELEVDIRSVVDLVFESTLGQVVDWSAPKRATGTFDALVAIKGGFNGCVHIACDEALGRSFAAALFQIPPQEATPQDMRDALAEVVNIVGGNIKALLPDENSLSLPQVAQAPETLVDRLAGDLVAALAFASGDGACEVRLYRESGAASAARG